MRKVTLTRTETTDQGTFGRLQTDTGLICVAGELPWRQNERKRSCIPPGTYRCTWRMSTRFGSCYHVEGVPGRSEILIHRGNFCGDTAKGFKSDVEGCILPGVTVGELEGQRAVKESKQALLAFETDLGREPFELTILDRVG